MRKRAATVFFCMALLLAMGVPGLAHGEEGDPVPVADWPALKAAVEAGGAIVLELPPVIEADSSITVPASANVVLVAHASGSRIVRQSLKTGEFIVSAGAKLTLRGNMTIAHDTNLNGANFVQVQSGGELLLEAQLAADADNVEYGNQNTDRNGEFIQSLIDCSGKLTMTAGSRVSGWTQNKQADRHNVNYDPGAAIRISGQGASFIMDGGTITGNTNTNATNSMLSSVVQILNGSEFYMNGGSISGNSKGGQKNGQRMSSTLGGGVYVCDSTFYMNGGTISDNEARDGGGIYNGTGAYLSATDTEISGNTAVYGGGIYGTNAGVKLVNCLLEGNAAICGSANDCGGGGLLLTRESTLSISNTVIQNNTSEKDGGGLYLEKMGATTELGGGVSLLDNSAAGIGGGLVNVASQTELSGATVSGNQASDGAGAANLSGGTLVLSGGMVTGNAAASTGGGIVNSEAVFRMTGGLIFNNLAGDAGADVANYGGSSAFTLPDARTLGIVGVECWFEDGSADGSIPRYVGHETEVPQYVSFTENTDVHFLTLGEVLQVLFDKNGGDTEPVPACIYIRKGCPLATLPTEPARSGHAFTGWNTQADDSGQAFVAGTTVNANLTVYAQWQKIEVPSGSLTVSLTVTGDGAEQDRAFRFTAVLQDRSINGSYGGLTFANGVASFTLKSGGSLTASGLPAGVSYEIVEEVPEGYSVLSANATGVVMEGQAIRIPFENRRELGEQPPEEALPPETSDGARPGLWGAACCGATACLAGTLAYAAKRRNAAK